MAVDSFESLKLIILALIAVVCAQNEPDFEYKCDRSGMHIKMTFDLPFRGLVYIKGYSNDPKCRLAFQVPVLEASFNIPLMACDMIPHFPNPWISGIIVFQQHPLIPTINDTSLPLACAVEGSSDVTNWSEVLRKAQLFSNDYPKVVPWLEFVLAPGILEGKTLPYPNSASIITFRVHGANLFNDMLVTECVAHDEAIIAHNTSIHQMTEPIGCSNTITETHSSFNVTKSDRGKITGAFAEFNLLSIPHPKKSFISCSAVLCIDKCQCPKNGSALGYQLFATRKLLPRRYKRSTSDEMRARSNNGNYGIRDPLLRSTFKALRDRLVNNRRQPRIEKKDTDFDKRFMPNLDEVTTAKLPATYNFKLDPTSPERVTATEFNTDFNFSIESKHVDEKNVSSANLSAMFIPELEFEKFRIDLGEISTKSSLLHESTSKDPLSVTLIQEDDIEKMFHLFELTTEDVLNPDTTLDSKDLQLRNFPNKRNEDFISTIDLTAETLGEMVNKTIVNERQENDCVPRIRFVMVTASLSFIGVCLILGICGLVLYMGKEKKKRAIDSFFLYNFY